MKAKPRSGDQKIAGGQRGLQHCWIEWSVTGAVKIQNLSFVIHQLSFYELAV
jgi:hypothetical protein